MRVDLEVGDVLDAAVDALVSTANPHLNMSGGVGGAILQRGGIDVQSELWEYLGRTGRPVVAPGSVIRTGPGPLKVKHIMHAVTVDIFYESSVQLIEGCIKKSLELSRMADARSVAMPALATGYGPLTMRDFAESLRRAVGRGGSPVSRLVVVLRRGEEADIVREVMGKRPI